MVIVVAALVLGVLLGALILIPRDRKFDEACICLISSVPSCINKFISI